MQHQLPRIQRRKKNEWQDHMQVTNFIIPEYDAKKDAGCPLSVNESFNKTQRRLHRVAVKKKKKILPAPTTEATQFESGCLNTSEDNAEVPANTSQSSVTYQMIEDSNCETEMNIIKLILVRECCIDELKRQVKIFRRIHQDQHSEDKKPWQEIYSLVAKLRDVGVDIVEQIALWRVSLGQPRPFTWKGENYMLRMISDLDFLKSAPEAMSWLDCPLEHNPLLTLLTVSNYDSDIVHEQIGAKWKFDIDRVKNAVQILVNEERLYEALVKKRREETNLSRVVPSSASSLLVEIPNEGENLSHEGENSIVVTSKVNEIAQDIEDSKAHIDRLAYELKVLTARSKQLSSALSKTGNPNKLRRINQKLGAINNEIKYRSGDMYKRKNELTKKRTVLHKLRREIRIIPQGQNDLRTETSVKSPDDTVSPSNEVGTLKGGDTANVISSSKEDGEATESTIVQCIEIISPPDEKVTRDKSYRFGCRVDSTCYLVVIASWNEYTHTGVVLSAYNPRNNFTYKNIAFEIPVSGPRIDVRSWLKSALVIDKSTGLLETSL